MDRMPDDPYKPPPSEKDKLDEIAEAILAMLWTVIVFELFGLVALWRILYELQQRG